ncbi:MAG TPA: fasciclin domain-containing protein, partial [Tepidisphaeraceae bacterium]|nr:fasciclin domain-containing protein [Tepidisphaeraceae bacterium]
LNTLAAALGQAELEEVLSHDEWTLFAPTDEAFAQLPAEKLDFLLQPENKEKLKALLLAHVVEGAHASASATTEPKPIKSAQGAELQLSKAANGKMQISTASVVEADIVATNGVIHTIDAVIMPAGLID